MNLENKSDELKSSVLLISNGFQPNYEKAFANGVASNGVLLDLVASDRALSDEFMKEIELIHLRGSQDPARSASAKALNLIRYGWLLHRHLRARKYSIIHLTGMFLTSSLWLGLLECCAYKIFCKQLFLTVHNLLPHERHTAWNRWLLKRIYRRPHKLIVHTSKAKSGLVREFGIDASRIVVVGHGVDSVPDEFGIKPAQGPTINVLIFGALSPYKGADLLIKALKKCRSFGVELTIVGECRNNVYAEEIARLLNDLPANHRASWHRGYIDEADVRAYFESADVVALPYRHIDQSGVLFSAFRYGVPVIATDVGSFKECLPAFAGLVSPELSPDALAATLSAFYLRREQFDREKIKAHGRALAWKNTVAPLVDLYRGSPQKASRSVQATF